MNKAYVTGENVITSLGFTSQDVFSRMRRDEQGFRNDHGMKVSLPLVPLSLVNDLELDRRFELAGRIPGRAKTLSFSRLEKLFAVSIHEAVHELSLDLTSPDTLLILSTTKGNIKFLEEGKAETDEFHRLYLWDSGKILQEFFHFAHPPVIIANACISGSLAIGMASLYVKAGLYKNVIVSGADLLSEFVVSGFLSFQALSPEPCKPFDKDRNGLSLGEGCGTIVLSSEIPAGESVIEVAGFASSDDANHISGPSRTGEELAFAIQKAMNQANVDPAHLDFISSHGTATAYNDEMESKAFAISGVSATPMNSFKGYFGHTLGAAGLIESALTIRSMKENLLIACIGFRESGVPMPVNVIRTHTPARINAALKTVSGFGGCNTALVFKKSTKDTGK